MTEADEIGLVLSADGEQLLCHPCLMREQRRAERHAKNFAAGRSSQQGPVT
jgi:hypothetical protein